MLDKGFLNSFLLEIDYIRLMKSKIIFHFFIFLFGFFVGNLFPTFFGHIVGSITSLFLLLILEGFNFIGTRGAGVSRAKLREVAPQASAPQQDLPNFGKDKHGLSIHAGKEWLRRGAERSYTKAYAKSPRTPGEIHTAASSYSNVLVSIFNSLKIGILFGLFVDAFKVGS
jgi:hypothetical protein